MMVYLILMCQTAWPNFYDADNCRVAEVYTNDISARLRINELCEDDLRCFGKTHVLPYKVKQ